MNNKFQAIESASQGEITIEMRPVYIINGANRAYLSERSALNKLSSILAEREIHKEGFETNYESESVTLENGTIAYKRGEPTEYFVERKESKLLELHQNLKNEKEILRLQTEYAKAVVDSELANDSVDVIFNKLQNALNNKI